MEGTLTGGKKWASGTTVSGGTTENFTLTSTATTTARRIEVSGLNFKPSVVYIWYSSPWGLLLNSVSVSDSNFKSIILNDTTQTNSMASYWLRYELEVNKNSSSYIVPKMTNNGFLLYTRILNVSCDFYWVAYE